MPLAKLAKRNREKAQCNKSTDDRGAITKNKNEIQKIIREYLKNVYLKNLEKKERHTFLDAYDVLKLKQEYINNLNRPKQVMRLNQ